MMPTFKKSKLYLPLKVGVVALILLVSIGFAERKQDDMLCQQIIMDIDRQWQNHFVDEADLLAFITNNGQQALVGKPLNSIDLKAIEVQLLQHPYIDRAEVYKDLLGNLTASVRQVRPMARLLVPGHADRYIDREGLLLPFSSRYTPRVMLVSGSYVNGLLQREAMETDDDKALLQLIQYIDQDELLRAQIAELEVNNSGTVVLHQQVGKQYIQFGKAESIDEKFEKLRLFYKQILPRQGWNTYTRVDLRYKEQIICE